MYIQICWTAPTVEEARRIAKALIEQRLVACVHLIPEVESHFFWEGEIKVAREVEVVFKTKSSYFRSVKEYILKECSYEMPEILALPILDGHTPYLEWINQFVIGDEPNK